VSFEDFIAFSAKEIPVGRVGQPEDIAHLVSFFVSEGAGFVSGQVVYAAGGPKACTGRTTGLPGRRPALHPLCTPLR